MNWRAVFGVQFRYETGIAGWITPHNRILSLTQNNSHINDLVSQYPEFSDFSNENYQAVDQIFDRGFIWFREDPGATSVGVIGVQCHPSRMQDAIRILRKFVTPPEFKELDISLWKDGVQVGRKVVDVE